MQEIPVLLNLVLVYVCAKLDMQLGLSQVFFKLMHPDLVVFVHMFVQFIQHAEICTGRAAYDKSWIVLLNDLPCTPPICHLLEVKTICQV